MIAANQQTAQAVGLGATDITQITPITTNGGQFDLKDGASTGEKAGALLAAMSGGDQISGSVALTISQLKAQIANGQLTAAGQVLLLSGAVKAAVQGGAALQALVAEVLAQSNAVAKFTIDTVAGDNIVSGAEVAGLKITGTVASGARSVLLHLGARNVNATITGPTTWSYDVTAADLAALGTGVVVISADAVLGAGTTASASRPVAIYTTPPPKPTLDPISGDGYINAAEASQGLTISGTTAPGNTITLQWDKTGGTSPATVDPSTGRWSVSYRASEIPQDAANRVTVFATDQFGNVSELVSRAVYYDVIAPDTPTIKPLNANNKVGLSATTTAVSFKGTGEPGSIVTFKWGNYTQTGIKVDSNGDWTVTVQPGDVPANGAYTVSVTLSDAAGNVSPAAEMPVLVSKTAPPSPTVDKIAGGDNYVSKLEATNGFKVSGTALPGQTVYVKISDGTVNSIASQTVDSQGGWTVSFTSNSTTASSNLPDKPAGYDLTAWVVDTEGNKSADFIGPKVIVDKTITIPTIAVPEGADQTILIGKAARDGTFAVTGRCDDDVVTIKLTFTDVSTTGKSWSFTGVRDAATPTSWSARIQSLKQSAA